MPWTRRRGLACRACLWIVLAAFLWIQGGAGVALARPWAWPALFPERPFPPPCLFPAGEGGPARVIAPLTAAPPDSGDATRRAPSRLLYKRRWFIVGVGGLAVLTAVLLASRGSDREEPAAGGPLPGFPPPPAGR